MKQTFAEVPVERLKLAPNVRAKASNVAELADSIRRVGILEPIVGYLSDDKEHVLVLMGQRRLAAAKRAGLSTVPTLVRSKPDEQGRVLMQLAENLDRSEMTPIEEATAFKDLVTLGMTQTAICKAVNRSQHHVATRLMLLDLPHTLRNAIHELKISPSVAMSIPRVLFTDAEILDRMAKVLRGDCTDSDLRSWAYKEVEGLDSSIEVRASYQLDRPVSVPVPWVELGKRASRAAGKSFREWVRDAIETTARAEGHELPEGVRRIVTTARPAREVNR